jgi:hypothetical protein
VGRLLGSAGAGLAGFALALFWRRYAPELALVTGVAVGLLAFATFRTVDRLRALRRR